MPAIFAAPGSAERFLTAADSGDGAGVDWSLKQRPLFQGLVAAGAGSSTQRWARCVTGAVALHMALVAGLALAGLNRSSEVPAATEPEVVFYAFRPPPPPAVTSPPASVKVQARRSPRSEPLMPRQVPRLEPMGVQQEPVPETAAAEPEPVDEAASTPAPSATGGVAEGVAGGVAGGAVGGLLGAADPGPLTLSQVMRAPKVVRAVKPDYPRSARLAGVEGLVVVQVVIGADGDVEEAQTRVLRSVPGLDSAAIAAVAQYRFTPALGRDGRPVRVMVHLPLQFNLR